MHYVNADGFITVKSGNKNTFGYKQNGKQTSHVKATELLTALKNMRGYHRLSYPPNTGICGQITKQYLALGYPLQYSPQELVGSLSKDWEHYSGSPNYPIRTGNKGGCEQYGDTDLYWTKRSAYGRARYQLLEFLIAKVEAMIETSEHDCLEEEIQAILNKPKNKKFVVNVESYIDLNSNAPRETKTKVSVRKRRGYY